MRVTRWALSAILSAALLTTPVTQALPVADLGPVEARAEEPCKLKVTICQEINLVFWKWETCYDVYFFCD